VIERRGLFPRLDSKEKTIMAIDIYSIDQLYPTFTGNETNAEKIAMIMDYLYQLIESLKYTLYHLDEGNFSEGVLDQKPDMTGYVTDEELTEELQPYAKTSDLSGYVTDGELATELQPYAKAADVSTALANYVQKTTIGNQIIQANGMSNVSISMDPASGIMAIVAPGGLYVNGQLIG
jgi:hypothetical protein